MTEPLPDFGDLIQAFAKLRPTDAKTRREIAGLLGFDVVAEDVPVKAVARKQEKGAEIRQPEPERVAPQQETRSTSSSSGPSPAEVHNPFNTDLPPSVLRPVPSRAAPPNWGTALPLPPPPQDRAAPPAVDPLLVPRWTRGILSAALSGRSTDGEIDIEDVVRTISDGRPFRAVPRRGAPRFGRAVQVLVDASESMAPFLEDQAWLTQRIRVVAGRDRTEVLNIDGSDSFIAGHGVRFDWTPYFDQHVPSAGAVAILLSDLGIGRIPLAPWTSPAQWLSFARALRRRGVPLVAIVPYARERWPRALKRTIPILQWDARTTARSARRALETRLRLYGRSKA